MKNVIENLKNYYKPVYEAKRSRAFFFSLADYVSHIETTPELKWVIQDIMKEKEELLKEKDKYEAKVQQELQESKRIILKVVSKAKKAIPKLNEALKELESFEKSTTDEYSRADHLENRLWDISMVLYQNGYKKELKPLIDDKTDNPNVYLDYKRFRFSPSLIEKRRLNKKIETLRETKLWGCWDYLRLVPAILLEGKEFGEVVSLRDLGMGIIYVELKEMIKIGNNIWNEITLLPTRMPPEEAREMLKYKLYASRIHNCLLEELDLQVAVEESQTIPLYQRTPTQEKSAIFKALKEKAEKANERRILKQEIIEELESKKETQDNNRPFCIVENNWGYLKFDKYGEKIKIGTPKSRHFRLLQYLLEPFRKAKTIEAVYEWIKLPKDKKDSDLSGWDNYKKKGRQITIIQNTIKELQKDNKLRGKLAFEFDDTKSKIWAKSLE